AAAATVVVPMLSMTHIVNTTSVDTTVGNTRTIRLARDDDETLWWFATPDTWRAAPPQCLCGAHDDDCTCGAGSRGSRWGITEYEIGCRRRRWELPDGWTNLKGASGAEGQPVFIDQDRSCAVQGATADVRLPRTHPRMQGILHVSYPWPVGWRPLAI